MPSRQRTHVCTEVRIVLEYREELVPTRLQRKEGTRSSPRVL